VRNLIWGSWLAVIARGVLLCLAAGLALSLTGCESLTSTSAQQDPGIAAQLPPYSGPKASLAVAKFEWKAPVPREVSGGGGPRGFTAKEQQSYCAGLEDMLSTVLVQCGRYKVLERSALDSIRAEQELGRSGEASRDTAAATGKIKGADLLVVAAITGFEPGTSGVSAGIGGGRASRHHDNSWTALAGALLASYRKSSIAMDIRIIDSTTSEVVAAGHVDGSASDIDLGALVGHLGSHTALAGGLNIYAKTPMEKAIRVCLYEAVKYIVNSTPRQYFKY